MKKRKCVITWPDGETVIPDVDQRDPRIAAELDRLEKLGVEHPICVEFIDDRPEPV